MGRARCCSGLVFVTASRSDAMAGAGRGSRARRMGRGGLGGARAVAASRAITSSSPRAPRCRSHRGPHRSCWPIAGAGIVVIAIALVARPRTLPQVPASRFGYPGFVLATGIGFLVLLDLSANASAGNRYLALYHQGHLWLAMTVLCVVAMLRQPIGRALAWTLSMIDGIASGIGARIGAVASAVALVALAVAVSVAFGTLLSNMRQLTSELGRLWLIGGAAWFFFMRGTPLAERLARSGNSIGSLVRYVMPLAFVTLVLSARWS